MRYVRPGFLWQGSKPGRRERRGGNGKMLENLIGKYRRVWGSNLKKAFCRRKEVFIVWQISKKRK